MTTLTVHNALPSLMVVDKTGAVDKSITDGSRGLLWRILATGGPIDLDTVLRSDAEGTEIARLRLRELAEAGYIRKVRDGNEWVVEAAAVPMFDGNSIKPEYLTGVFIPAQKESPAIQKKKPPKKRTEVLPGYHELLAWLKAPDGGNYTIVAREHSRVGQSINATLQIALDHDWVDESGDIALLVSYIQDCLRWIEEKYPYRGMLDIHNVSKRIQEWWNVEGKQRYQESEVYTPVLIQ